MDLAFESYKIPGYNLVYDSAEGEGYLAARIAFLSVYILAVAFMVLEVMQAINIVGGCVFREA